MKIHSTAEVEDNVVIGERTFVWHYAQIRRGVVIGDDCILGKNVYVDFDVKIGNKVKIQNNACIYHGAVIEDGVFIGPGVILTNDKNPRAITADGKLKGNDDWEVAGVTIKYGAAIGAGAVICPGVTIGEWAMVGAGAVVVKDVPEHAVVVGNPARVLK